ncbi:MAG: tRNA (N6-isopentenyl adenosine(37)-C2)-methylthiotransferase MiaB [Succinatimonas hippei]|nr:tRNA (N6-isopentenyl adenosine(37)-C2)-methylthiotransferase MiaB [Succinatimonas hippei]
MTLSSQNSISMQSGSFYIAVWGCQMNVYDTSRIRGLLLSRGYTEVSSPLGASVVVLVTCAVRAKAENKVFNQIASWRHDGLVNQSTVIALGGCVGTELGHKIIEAGQGVSVVFSPMTIHRLPDLIETYQKTGQPVCDVDAGSMEKFDSLPDSGLRGVSAFVTIMEGCSNKCTYCIVPYTRGEEESRRVSDVLDECRRHLDNGALELHLLGQNVNSYRGLNDDGSECSFAELLYQVASLDGAKRVRFTTSNPMDFSQELVGAIGELPNVAQSVHIPVQSGSDEILRRMHRRYTHDSYLELIASLRAARPDIRVSSDFIVGFPGETGADFEETMRLVREVRFDQSFSFIYSKRPGTPAADYPDETSAHEKKQRIYALQELLESYARDYSKSDLGTVQEVLVEGLSSRDSGELKGRTSANRIAVFKGEPSLIGKAATIKITDVLAHTLRGELI